MSFQIKKSKDRFCSRVYRMWLCAKRCFFCQSTHSDPHHLKTRKFADGSDALCIPVCRECHGKIHAGKIDIRDMEFEGSLQHLWVSFLWEHGIEYVLPLTQADFENLLKERGLTEVPFTRRKNR